MVQIPENTVTMEDMVEWNKMQTELRVLKAKEMLLRRKIYEGLFTDPREGVNTLQLSDGWELKANRVIDRKIELATLQAMASEGGPFEKANINANMLIKWEPELVVKQYRTLTAEQLAVFDQCLVIKDGSPALSIVLPKKNAK